MSRTRPGPDTFVDTLQPVGVDLVDPDAVKELTGILSRCGVTYCPTSLRGASPPSTEKQSKEADAVKDTVLLWVTRITDWVGSSYADRELLGITVTPELCIEVLGRMVYCHGGLFKTVLNQGFISGGADMYVKRLREWDGFCAAPTTEKTVETVRAFALAVWRTVKGTRAKSKEVVRVKRSSTLKQTPLDVAKFKKQPVEVQEKDGEKDGLIVLSEEEDSSSSLNDAEFERGALAAAKDVGLSFPHPINQRTRAGIKEGQKEAGKEAGKEATKEPYKIVPLKGQNSPPLLTSRGP